MIQDQKSNKHIENGYKKLVHACKREAVQFLVAKTLGARGDDDWKQKVYETTGSPESQQHTGSQIIRICMEIYLKIDKTVKLYKNSY